LSDTGDTENRDSSFTLSHEKESDHGHSPRAHRR
jgi:hypothetical protein